jgi:phospholipid transport system substrate-binding protein
MRNLIRTSLAVFAIAAMLAPPLRAAPAPKEEAPHATARAAADSGISQILAVLQDKTLDKPARDEKLKVIVENFTDFDTLARLSLGGAWRELTDPQRDEFIVEFKRHMLGILARATKGYEDEKVAIIGDRAEARGGDHTVQTRVTGPKDGQIKEIALVDFRFRQKDQQWKVIDVTIKGISMAATFRAQFVVIMKDGGIEKVLELMRNKNAAIAPPAPAPVKPEKSADADK